MDKQGLYGFSRLYDDDDDQNNVRIDLAGWRTYDWLGVVRIPGDQ
jgi:hypothetical protein